MCSPRRWERERELALPECRYVSRGGSLPLASYPRGFSFPAGSILHLGRVLPESSGSPRQRMSWSRGVEAGAGSRLDVQAQTGASSADRGAAPRLRAGPRRCSPGDRRVLVAIRVGSWASCPHSGQAGVHSRPRRRRGGVRSWASGRALLPVPMSLWSPADPSLLGPIPTQLAVPSEAHEDALAPWPNTLL